MTISHEDIQSFLASAERLCGLTLSLKWISPPGSKDLRNIENYHQHPFCLAQKGSVRGLDACKQDCQFRLESILKDVKRYTSRRCYAGVVEWLFPLRYEQRLIGVLCAGPLALPREPDIQPSLEWINILLSLGHTIEQTYANYEQNNTHQYSDPINRACNFMDKELQRAITVDDIAEVSTLSASRLMHRFRDETGKTITEFLLHLRIDRAQKMLARNNDRISEVARAVGMPNQTYFGQRFKALTGMTPRQYRQNHHSKTLP